MSSQFRGRRNQQPLLGAYLRWGAAAALILSAAAVAMKVIVA